MIKYVPFWRGKWGLFRLEAQENRAKTKNKCTFLLIHFITARSLSHKCDHEQTAVFLENNPENPSQKLGYHRVLLSGNYRTLSCMPCPKTFSGATCYHAFFSVVATANQGDQPETQFILIESCRLTL